MSGAGMEQPLGSMDPYPHLAQERASKEGSLKRTATLLNLNGHLQDFGATSFMALRSRDALCLAIVTTAHNRST